MGRKKVLLGAKKGSEGRTWGSARRRPEERPNKNLVEIAYPLRNQRWELQITPVEPTASKSKWFVFYFGRPEPEERQKQVQDNLAGA